MKLTILTEERRYQATAHGYTKISWRCHKCNCIICLPQQQNFGYCMHCGAKIIKKFGGKE